MYGNQLDGSYGTQAYPTPPSVTIAGELEGLAKLASEVTRVLQDVDARLSGRQEAHATGAMGEVAVRPSVMGQVTGIQSALNRSFEYANRIREQVG